jgi:glycosyltransferase involved in cell wall biosynthesis
VRILAFYPALNPAVNDIAAVLGTLVRRGHQVLVVTARRNRSKSTHDRAVREQVDGLTILRPYRSFPAMVLRPMPGPAQVVEEISAFGPEIALCSHEGSVRTGLALRALTGRALPLVVVTEDGGRLAARGYEGLVANIVLPLVGMPRGRAFWPWLGRQSAMIVTCHPADRARLAVLSVGGPPVVHIPWCNALPPDLGPLPAREPDLAVYIGAFSRRKGTDRLGELVPALLTQTPTRRVVLVGTGRTRVVRWLTREYGDRINYRPGLPRRDALALLARAAYGICPTVHGGWGLIGDCWAVGTPLVALASDYQLNDGVDALVGGDVEGVVERVRGLCGDAALAHALAAAGHRRYQRHHSTAAVGRRYEAVLEAALHGSEVVW